MNELLLFHSELAAFNKVRKQLFNPVKVKNIRRDKLFVYIEFELLSPTQAFVLGQMFQSLKDKSCAA
jgi:hypothetical protein